MLSLKTRAFVDSRPWRQSDLTFYSTPVDGVGQMAGWKPHVKTREESRLFLICSYSHKKTFALEYRGQSNRFIGIEKYNETHFGI